MMSMSVAVMATMAAVAPEIIPNLTVLGFALAKKVFLGSTRAQGEVRETATNFSHDSSASSSISNTTTARASSKSGLG